MSCDDIRKEMFGKNYKFTKENEDKVWNKFYDSVELNSYLSYDFIIDNTNCREKYINKIKSLLSPDCKVEIKYFHISLWKAYYRNVMRWMNTGKWIPFKVIKNMKRNFDKMTKL